MGPRTKTVLSASLAKQIVNLWRNPKFSGAFLGIAGLKKALKREKKIDVPYNELLKLMMKEPNYIKTIRPRRRFPRRKLKIHGYGVLAQADLAVMPKTASDFNCFLLYIDAFSRKIFCRAQKNKSSDATKKSLKSIFDEMKMTPEVLETDNGSEFKALKGWLKESKVSRERI